MALVLICPCTAYPLNPERTAHEKCKAAAVPELSEVDLDMKMPAIYLLAVVSIRNHGIMCKIANQPGDMFATLPKDMVTTALAAVGKPLSVGEEFSLILSGAGDEGNGHALDLNAQHEGQGNQATCSN